MPICVLQVLLDAKVSAVKDAIIATSTEATQEASLEDLLAKVVAKWANIELTVIPYKDSKDVYILGAIDNVQVSCEKAQLCLMHAALTAHAHTMTPAWGAETPARQSQAHRSAVQCSAALTLAASNRHLSSK